MRRTELLIYFLLSSFLLPQSMSLNGSSHISFGPPCLPSQSSLLLQLKEEFSGNQSLSSWKTGSDCCFWSGVTCDKVTGEVVGLDLSSRGLKGPITWNSSLFRLTQIQELNLAFNNFNASSIPPQISNLTRLVHLNLSKSLLSGEIPWEISLLTNLVSLDLSVLMDGFDFISFKGAFPSDVFLLPNIQTISLSGNADLSGFLPEFHRNSSLTGLDLSSTNFSGNLPGSIGNLKNLKDFNFFYCKFSGLIPSSLGNLSELVSLDLSSNGFYGQLPSSLERLVKLVSLDLSLNSFSSRLPPSFLGNLTQLTTLDLSFNSLEGQLPPSFLNLVQLGNLFLSSNNFQGSILFPNLNLSQLVALDLSSNHFTGSFPFEIITSSNFYSLDLSMNSFTGAIPPSLFSIPNLEYIILQKNKFSGSLVFQNVSSSQISILDLSQNSLNGTVPREIGKLVNLQNLDLSFNDFQGTLELDFVFRLKRLSYLALSGISLSIPEAMDNATSIRSLTYLVLSSCNISKFPGFLKTQSQLATIDLSFNLIVGNVPDWLWSFKALELLNISHNFLTNFEESLGIRQLRLAVLDIHSNKLQGPVLLPSMMTVVYLASDNQFHGEISTEFCELRHLVVLDLSNNQVNGTIPQCLGNSIDGLVVLKLQANNFHGIIPEVHLSKSIRIFDLSSNKLEGKVPASLATCQDLELLNLGNNGLEDVFPFWLESLPKLRVLILGSNRFFGPIRRHPNNSFAKLQIIDLSRNNFSGGIEYFTDLEAMKVEEDNNGSRPQYIGDDWMYANRFRDSITLTTKGGGMQHEIITTTLTLIDLSGNKFQGEIPSSIGNLKGLIGLNLSSNTLTGHIPSSLGNLSNLESLDLSGNTLSGEIPQEIVDLTFLEYLNLSYNQLTGPIPQGGQFGTFLNPSFEGNPGLCGPPLPKCGLAGPPSGNQGHDEPETISKKAIIIGTAFGLVNGMVLGYLTRPFQNRWFSKILGSRRRRR